MIIRHQNGLNDRYTSRTIHEDENEQYDSFVSNVETENLPIASLNKKGSSMSNHFQTVTPASKQHDHYNLSLVDSEEQYYESPHKI